ncbi:hypothetical protein M758_4G125800 [Ceratodon purpureus]|uniref:Uncharacterized protein n=1 Tax=Ceratodon purpureus TaxID=3225 RepID=A0A8T0I9Z7_CERPU|nr:hypothetical protein KC19_4G124600 [Ceratodon purpureus]KAG0619249.1 hypothetical protein M758_4G125800 [Ceratodon purpureus]
MTATSAFITSLLTSFGIFCGLAFAFGILSKWKINHNIYYPSRILRGDGVSPSATKRNPFTWIKEAVMTSEEELVRVAGLDAAIYLNFFACILEIFGYSALFCVPVLIPIAATSHNNAIQFALDPNQTYEGFDNLAMGNVEEQTPKIWAFLVGTYWVSISTYVVLIKHYKKMIRLRGKEQAHESAKPQQFACLVRDIPAPPKHMSRREQVNTFFKKLHSDTYETCMIVTNVRKLMKIWTKYQASKRNLERAEVVFEESKTNAKPEGTRPMHRLRFFGFVGTKVDSINFYDEEVKDLARAVEIERQRTLKEEQLPAAFVFFNSRRAAAEAAQAVHAPYAMQWQVYPAPEPREVVWNNLAKSVYSRMVRSGVVYFTVFMTVLFYMIPIALISSFTTLDNLVRILPFLKVIVNYKPINTVLQAYLPQVALIVFLALLPALLMFLSRLEGIPSQSHLVRAASGKYFYFIIFNVFLGVTLFGTIFSSLAGFKELLNSKNFSVSSVVTLFGSKLPPVAAYFITFVALQFFVGYGLELSRLVPLIVYHLKKKFMCKTEKELEEAWAPGPFEYHTLVPNDILILMISMAYAVIAPMILLFALLYFAIGYVVLRNQALKVYVPDFESGGRMWPHIHARILAALFIGQITMMGYFGIKKFPYAVLVLILPLFTVFFSSICKLNYYPSFNVMSLAIASEDVKDAPPMRQIVEAYTPECLLSEEDVVYESEEKFEDARSSIGSRSVSRSNSGVLSSTEDLYML